MKHVTLCFIFLITGLSGFTQATITKIQYQDKDDTWNFIFPIITLTDKASAQKINDYLQAVELQNTTRKVKPANLFDRAKYIQRDSNTQFGFTNIGYNIILNTPKLLSLEVFSEWMAAYPDNGSRYYNFNSQNGELVLAEELFTPDGLKKVRGMLIAERSKLIKKALAEIKKDPDSKEELDMAVETFTECNKSADEQYFTLKPGKIIFYKGHCFPHAAGNMEANLDVAITYAQLVPYMSAFGKKALIQKDAIIKNDVFHSIKKPLYGTIDNKYQIVMQLDYFGGSPSGSYYYTSQGICIEITGSITGKNIELKENNENGDETAIFKGVIEGTTISGTWTDFKSGKQLPFTVKN